MDHGRRVTTKLKKLAMPCVLGAAFLSHQVEQLERASMPVARVSLSIDRELKERRTGCGRARRDSEDKDSGGLRHVHSFPFHRLSLTVSFSYAYRFLAQKGVDFN